MLRITSDEIPKALHGYATTDSQGIPRYWVTVWSAMVLPSCAASTQRRMIRDVESLYCHCILNLPDRDLDAMLFSIDLPGLETLLDSFFLTIAGKQNRSMEDERRWKTVVGYIRFVITWSETKTTQRQLSGLFSKLRTLEARYLQLRVHRKRKPEPLRSLPPSVVKNIYEILAPDSDENPFRTAELRWGAFVLFLVYLHLGLRRGEALLLAVDCLKEQIDERSGEVKYWISVKENHYSLSDDRYSTPSLKTVNSVRQIPVGYVVASAIRCYVSNFRGKQKHSYLIASQYGIPMSAESVARIFSKISQSISDESSCEMLNRTGKTRISPHDLRHTCAVLRLSQMLDRGDATDLSLQKMRSFFGWSAKSMMPIKYARAVFENSLQEGWSQLFDDRVEIMRVLGSRLYK